MQRLKVIGETREGKTVAGEFVCGIMHKNDKKYYVRTFDNAIIECVECRDDKQKRR